MIFESKPVRASPDPDNTTIQPSAKDTYLNELDPTFNYGSSTTLHIYDRSDSTRRSILEFDLSGIPAGATLSSASLQLYYGLFSFSDPVGKVVWAYKLTRINWVQSEATWDIYKTGSNWTSAGGDYVTTEPSGDSTTFPANYGWMTWDVLAIVQDAYDSGNPAEFLIRFETEGLASDYSRPNFYSKEYTTDPTLQPKLYIEYTIPSQEYERSIEQSFSLTESTPRGIEFGRTIEQGFSIGAVLAMISEICAALSQVFGITASLGVVFQRGKELSQDFSFDGSVSVQVEYGCEIGQPLSISAEVTAEREFAKDLGAGLSFTAVIETTFEWGEVLSQEFSLSESIEMNKEVGYEIAQDFSVTESITAEKSIAIGLSDTFSFSATTISPVDFIRELSESLSFSPILESEYEYGISLSGDFTLSTIVDAIKEIDISLSQPLSFTATLGYGNEFIISLVQDFTLVEIVQTAGEVGIDIAQSYSIADEMLMSGEYNRSLSGDFSLDDVVDTALQKEITITQGFSLAETLQAIRHFGISITQSYSISEAVIAGEEYGRSLSQQYSLAGVVTASSELTRIISQDFSLAEIVGIDVARYLHVYSYEVSAVLSFTGEVIMNIEYGRTISQGFSFTGEVEADIQRYAMHERALPQEFSFTDLVAREVVHLKPEIVGPIENQPYFVWTFEGADYYRLLVDNDLDFSSPRENRILFENYYQIPPENALENGIWYWKVIAYFDGEEVESDVWSFVVGEIGVSPVTDLSGAAIAIATFAACIAAVILALGFTQTKEESLEVTRSSQVMRSTTPLFQESSYSHQL